MQQTETSTTKRSLLAKIGRGLGIFILSIIGLIVLVLILIQTAPVQNFARKKIVTYLSDKIIVDKTRLVYVDVVTGNDVDVYLNHFDTRINTFDPTNLRYDVPSIVLNGIRGSIKQSQPMAVTAVNTNPSPTTSNEAPKFL